MEEKILKTIRNNVELSLTGNYKSVYIDGQEKATKEISDHFKDFARWAIINAVMPFDKKNELIYIESGKVFKDIDELYNYWSDNVSK
jgi:hypothetical protein